MLIHFMLGTLFLAISCFVIGRLAGHPSLIGRKNRTIQPQPRVITRERMEIHTPDRRARMRISR